MEGGSGEAEAERWLTIAAKLLAARDLHGARTFAVRARESDPRYEGSSQVLAVSDTLLAGDSLVNNHPDWYSVLQLARFTHDSDLIEAQYRKLALLLNPVRTRLAFADQALKLVYDAWSILSNPSNKLLYDNELQMSQLGQLGQLGQSPPPEGDPLPSTPNQQSTPQPQPANQRWPTTPVRRSSRIKDGPSMAEEISEAKKRPIPEAEPSFWTACPYCYHLYEYPKVYEECTLRCQNCRRAFHAAVIPPPPLTASGRSAPFCSWGFFPLGFSGNAKPASTWSPISAMFACPLQPKRGPGRPRKDPAAPAQQPYYDDSDELIDLSDLSDDSNDDEWKDDEPDINSFRKKGKGPVGRRPLKKGVPPPGGLVVVHALSADPKKHPVASSGKKQSAKAAKDLGKLDLNVEFSNDVEEQGRSEGNGPRNGEEDNMEGIGFFEGLDEFLSSLPILNVVGEDKVKAS